MLFGVPLYVGEFNAISAEWGLTSVRRYVEAFERYGWAWSPWTYKTIEHWGYPTLWGVYRNEKRWRKHVDPYRESKRQILRFFEHTQTSNLKLNRPYLEALFGAAAGGMAGTET